MAGAGQETEEVAREGLVRGIAVWMGGAWRIGGSARVGGLRKREVLEIVRRTMLFWSHAARKLGKLGNQDEIVGGRMPTLPGRYREALAGISALAMFPERTDLRWCKRGGFYASTRYAITATLAAFGGAVFLAWES